MSEKYVQKPVVVEAVQWCGDNAQELEAEGFETNISDGELWIRHPYFEWLRMPLGWWLVKDPDGNWKLLSDEDFHERYSRR